MSIYIPNLDLHEDTMIRIAIWGDGTFCAVIDNVPIAQGKAIEVPEHGRLGDVDELEVVAYKNTAGFQDTFDEGVKYALELMDQAVTVIPADGADKEEP